MGLYYLTGWEHGLVDAAGAGIWSSTITAPSTLTADTAIVRNGNYCAKFNAVGQKVFANKAIVGGTRYAVIRAGIYFDTLPTSGECRVISARSSATGAVVGQMVYMASDGKLKSRIGGTGGTGVVINAGQWYLLEMRYDVGATTYTLDWSLDLVAQTQQTSASQTVGVIDQLGWGPTAAVTCVLRVDDYIASDATADYPWGDGHTEGHGVDPLTDGTHSVAAGGFKDYLGNTLNNLSINVHTFLDDPPPLSSTADWVEQTVVDAAGYLEVVFTDTAAATVNGAQALVEYHAGGTATTRIRSATTDTDIYVGSMSTVGGIPNYRTGIVNPDAGTWTPSKFNQLKGRIGFASAVGVTPKWDALFLEVDVLPITSSTITSTDSATGTDTGAPGQSGAPVFVGSGLWGAGFQNVLALSPDGATLIAGGDVAGIHFSPDQGASWKTADAADIIKVDTNVAAVAYDPTSSAKAYFAAGPGSGFWRSPDGGFTWVEVSSGIEVRAGNLPVAFSNPPRNMPTNHPRNTGKLIAFGSAAPLGAGFNVAQPNGYGFGPAGRPFGTPLRLWNPEWMSIFAGPVLPTAAVAAAQALYVELTAATLLTYPAGASLTALQARPAGTLPAKGLDYNIGGVEWLINPDDGNVNFPPSMFMYTTSAPPGVGLRNNAAFQTGASPGVANAASWIPRVEFPAYWQTLAAFYTSVLAGVNGSGRYDSTGFAQGILPDVMGPYPTTSFSNLNGNPPPDPWNFDTSTNQMYTAARWFDFIVAGVGTMRPIMGGPGAGNIGANGLVDGPNYFDAVAPTSRLLGAVDIAMAEEWIRGSGATADLATFTLTEAVWQQNVNMLFDAAVTFAKPILVCSKLWPNVTQQTLGQSIQWFGFLLASFLLGNANNLSCGKHWWHYRDDNANFSKAVTTSGGNVTSLGTNDGVAVGQTIRLAGFTNAANNGNKVVTAAAATTCSFSGIVNGDSGNCVYIEGTDGDSSGTNMKGRHHWRPDLNYFGTGNAYLDRVNSLGPNVSNVAWPGAGVSALKIVDTYVAQFANGWVLVNPLAGAAGASRLTLGTAPGGRTWTNHTGGTYANGAAVGAVAARTGIVIVAI